uniref:Uncharacterized protein n=1 Tax=Macrostomum lignano TaxID=282301 RepID=A0A1I8FCG1_9PLAT
MEPQRTRLFQLNGSCGLRGPSRPF